MQVPRERANIPPQAISLSKLLIVEGATPWHFFEALARDLELEKRIEIRDFGGISQLGVYLRTLSAGSDFKANVRSLGIARDAENNPAGAMQSVDAAVKSANLSEDVAVHVAILPDENVAGMIETLCLRAVASEPVMECVDTFFECVAEKGETLPEGIARDKHRARVYLAGKGLPELPVGVASHRDAWPFDDEAFELLKTFLKNL